MEQHELHSKGTFDPALFELDPAREITRLVLVKWARAYAAYQPGTNDLAKDEILTKASWDVRSLLNSALAQHWTI